jgi:protease-4
MFTDNSKYQLYPFLMNIMNGSPVDSLVLPETSFYYQSLGGVKSAMNNQSDVQSDSVAIVKVHHPIFKYDQECGPKGTQSIMDMMESWKQDSNIKGVLFDINSGGGQSSGSREFAEYVHEYNKIKPVVSFTKDTIGSAAYYFAAGSKYIIAHKHADFIGCIGSMYYSVDMEGVLNKKGATIHEIYADPSSEKNIESRELKEGNDRPLIEKLLNPGAKQFQEDTKKYRPQVSETALKGGIYSTNDALKEGLIDEVGTLQTAINKVFELAKANQNNSQNNSKQNMSKLNVPLIEAAIGGSFSDGETENGIILNDTEAEALETRLSVLTNAEKKVSDLEASSTSLTTAIQNALTTAEVENASSMSNEEGITALSNLIAKYGSEDGGEITNPLNSETSKVFVGAATKKLQETLKHL